MPTVGGIFEVTQPGDGETTELFVRLLDDDGVPVTGVTYDVAGMDVEIAKPGGSFADFPTFGAENWREVGRGVYAIIVRGADATEKALLDTEGLLLAYVKTDATSESYAVQGPYKVSPADVVREDTWTDVRASYLDRIPLGTGAYTVTLILSDGAGRLAGGLAVAIRDLAGNTVAGPLATDTAGRVTYYLDAGDYAVVTPSTSVWQGSSTPLTVTGDAAVAVTLVAQVLPLPSAPDKYVIIINAADEFGDLAGAGSWRIRITDVWPRGLPGADLVQLTRQTPIVLDTNGQATFEIAKETTAFALSITPQLAAGADGATEIIRVTVDPTVANEYDQIYLADILNA